MKFKVILNLKNRALRKKILALNLIQSTFNSDQGKFESLIHNWLFQEKHRAAIYFIIPFFFQSNEHYPLKCIKKLEGFTKENYSFAIIWKTRNIRSLFNLKNRSSHVSSVVNEGKCNRGDNYIGKTV